jgi:hypothetical protein
MEFNAIGSGNWEWINFNLTEIKNVGKLETDNDVWYSECDRTIRYGLLAISALSF